MDKYLGTIQKISKVGLILSRIVWIACIIGCVGCVIGAITYMIGMDLVVTLGNMRLIGFIESELDVMSNGVIYATLAIGFVICLSHAILAKCSKDYFRHELEAGTPFTHEGAEECKKLGILMIIISFAVYFISLIIYMLIKENIDANIEAHLDNYVSLGMGISFIILSIIFHYGANISQNNNIE